MTLSLLVCISWVVGEVCPRKWDLSGARRWQPGSGTRRPTSTAVAAEAEDREFWGRISTLENDQELAFWDSLHAELTDLQSKPEVRQGIERKITSFRPYRASSLIRQQLGRLSVGKRWV